MIDPTECNTTQPLPVTETTTSTETATYTKMVTHTETATYTEAVTSTITKSVTMTVVPTTVISTHIMPTTIMVTPSSSITDQQQPILESDHIYESGAPELSECYYYCFIIISFMLLILFLIEQVKIVLRT